MALITGYSDWGFSFEETHKLVLEFEIPYQSKTDDYPEVELWLFPDKSRVEPNTVEEITFLVKANVTEVSITRTSQGAVLWDTREDCITLNLTILSKRVYKLMKKKNLNESNVSLVVEITRTRTILTTLEYNHIRSLNRNFCSFLSNRITNDSFLVIKNYDEKIEKRKKRNIKFSDASPNVNEPTIINTNNCCNKSNLVVNLAEIYGDFVKGPTNINIWDCTGECTLASNSNLFSHHATVKERLKLLPDGEVLTNYQPRCTPVAFMPLHVLFSVKDKSDVIVQLLDLVVEKCACR